MIRRLYASDPDYATFNDLWTLNAIARNLHVYPFLAVDLPADEQTALIVTLDAEMNALLNDLPVYLAGVLEGIERAE